jgi:prolyl-tRNA editing enzyme YbaK/EbsC (Cys-tRNA(Pro) deacylase)
MDSVERVRQALAELGLATEIREFSASTRTSADAAAAIGCSVAQIAKSLVFAPSPRAAPSW